MEEFFREVGKYTKPLIHEALPFDEFQRLFQEHSLDVTGPPIFGKWKVEDGRMILIGA